jgi:hypothetical protein
MKRILSILAPFIVAAVFLMAGCLSTSTFVISAKMAPPTRIITNANYNSFMYVGTSDSVRYGKIVVNLEDYPDFANNKDKIASIDNLGFFLWAKNNATVPVTFQLFLMPDTARNFPNADSAASFASGSYLVFTGLALPARPTVGAVPTTAVDWNGSLQYISDLEGVKAALKSGHFSLYPAIFYGDDPDIKRDSLKITIDSLVVIVTLTGG